MSLGFYRAFEDRFRGNRELIKSRLDVYRGFLEPLLQVYPEAKALDLGCGRGEWLELLTEIGFAAEGVDLDEGMLDACRELGFNVAKEDALEYMSRLPDESQSVVSAFHLVEHIPFEALQSFVSEALRVLKPGGLLIMETPNPENIKVATENFYLDPTHIKPIPSGLLSFLPEFYGFEKGKILRLQESAEVRQGNDVSLLNVLNGVSPDYAVIAQKAAKPELLELSDHLFNAEYGVTLEQLVMRYSQQADDRAQQANDRAQNAKEEAQTAIETSRKVEERVRQLEERAQQQSDERASQAEERASEADAREQQAQIRAAELNTLILAIYASRSWGITRPIRWLGRKLKPAVEEAGESSAPIDELDNNGLLMRLKFLGRKVLRSKQVESAAADIPIAGLTPTVAGTPVVTAVGSRLDLTPGGRRKYNELMDAIERKSGVND